MPCKFHALKCVSGTRKTYKKYEFERYCVITAKKFEKMVVEYKYMPMLFVNVLVVMRQCLRFIRCVF